MSRATGAVCAALLLATLVSCAPPRLGRPPHAAVDPTQALQLVRQREDRIVSLRARFTADTRVADDSRRADGVLLVKKPDRFRMRLMLPFGPTIFDYLSWGERTQLSLPLRGGNDDRPPNELAPFSREDLGQAFLRGPAAFPGTCVPARDSRTDVVVSCRDDDGSLLRQLRISDDRAIIRDETSFEAGAPRMVLRFSDYRPIDDLELPFQITMLYPGRQLSVDIAINKYEVNPTLADALFEPSRPWGS